MIYPFTVRTVFKNSFLAQNGLSSRASLIYWILWLVINVQIRGEQFRKLVNTYPFNQTNYLRPPKQNIAFS